MEEVENELLKKCRTTFDKDLESKRRVIRCTRWCSNYSSKCGLWHYKQETNLITI